MVIIKDFKQMENECITMNNIILMFNKLKKIKIKLFKIKTTKSKKP